MSRVRRVLFFAEAVTLAHVARPIALARGLDRQCFEPILACDPRCAKFFASESFRTLPLHSIASADFLRSLARGSPVFDVDTLRRYVRDDLQLIRDVKPDLVVGDFRLSLSVSARLAGVPYATVTNAYWSPYGVEQQMPLPVLPMTKVLPIAVAKAIFDAARPIAMRAHCAALNRVRRENGLPTLGHDLRRVYTDADHVLYADVQSMFETRNLPANHHFIGPIAWSPPIATPAWWDDVPTDKPIVYLTLGSSGHPRVMTTALGALAELPVTVIASTAGAAVTRAHPSNVYVADYLDGNKAVRRAQLVVCNGGSLTSQQAVAASVPVLGIASNMDQFLNMAGVARSGAGSVLRADRADSKAIRAAAASLLKGRPMSSAALRLRTDLKAAEATAAFLRVAFDLTGQTEATVNDAGQ